MVDAGARVQTHERATSRKGDQPQNWPATDPSTGGHQPKNCSFFLSGTLCCYFLTWPASSRWSYSGPSRCGRSWYVLGQWFSCSVGDRFQIADVISAGLLHSGPPPRQGHIICRSREVFSLGACRSSPGCTFMWRFEVDQSGDQFRALRLTQDKRIRCTSLQSCPGLHFS